MGRRCRNWDYKGRGTYLITIAAANRGAGIWGHVETIHPASGVKPTGANGMRSGPLAALESPCTSHTLHRHRMSNALDLMIYAGA